MCRRTDRAAVSCTCAAITPVRFKIMAPTAVRNTVKAAGARCRRRVGSVVAAVHADRTDAGTGPRCRIRSGYGGPAGRTEPHLERLPGLCPAMRSYSPLQCNPALTNNGCSRWFRQGVLVRNNGADKSSRYFVRSICKASFIGVDSCLRCVCIGCPVCQRPSVFTPADGQGGMLCRNVFRETSSVKRNFWYGAIF